MNNLERVFIGIGSNRGRRRENCKRAVEGIILSGQIRIVEFSPLYESAPWGMSAQGPFVNAVIEVRSALGPMGLLEFLKGLERGLGRRRSARWGPRVIDLDLLFFGRRILNTRRLTLPHPRLHERGFVLRPMNDIAPDFVHPVLMESMRSLFHGLRDGNDVKRAKSQSI